ncbi:MAG: leucine-rich repeat protein [Butyrivibrio sp.]|nr:leucine-rich repeat protein [Butyrivibrio sp.]
MSILYEVAEHKRDKHEYIMITGYEGSVTRLVVPEEIDGMAVEAIGNHAFSGRQDLEEVVLPESIKTLFGFAFHNCRNLRKIQLFDSLDDYYDGVCRQCDNLEEVEITVKKSWYEVIRNFLADNDKTLRFLIHADGNDACLTFPEYVYDFNENTMARTIQFTIAGSGYAFRECVDRRRIDYRQYDSLFEKAIIDGSEMAQNIAIGRLLYPLELEERYKTGYENYLEKNGGAVLIRLIDEYAKSHDKGELDILEKVLRYRREDDEKLLFTDEDMNKATKHSADKKLTAITAMLMDAQAQPMSKEPGISEFSF